MPGTWNLTGNHHVLHNLLNKLVLVSVFTPTCQMVVTLLRIHSASENWNPKASGLVTKLYYLTLRSSEERKHQCALGSSAPPWVSQVHFAFRLVILRRLALLQASSAVVLSYHFHTWKHIEEKNWIVPYFIIPVIQEQTFLDNTWKTSPQSSLLKFCCTFTNKPVTSKTVP